MFPLAAVRPKSLVAGAGAALAPLGSQILFFGDGTGSEGAAQGLCNYPLHTLFYLNLRVFPSPAWMQHISGGDLDTIYARIDRAVDQQPDIFVFGSQGHNDPVMSTDPDLNSTYLDKWKRNLDYVVAHLTVTSYIFACTTIRSTVSGEASAASVGGGAIRDRVNALQIAYIATKAAADGRVKLADIYTAYNDPTNMSEDSGGNYTHPDSRGGYAIGQYLGAVIDPYVVAATKTQVIDALRGSTYPGLTGANLDADVLMEGTTGTKAGTVTPTGNYAAGKRITNNLTNGTSVAVAVSKDAVDDGTPRKQLAVVSGTPAAENTIIQDDTGSISATGTTPGQSIAAIWAFKIDDGAGGVPVGLRAVGAIHSNFGSIGTSGTDARTGTFAHVLDSIIVAAPRATFGSSGPFSANPAFQTRWKNAALTARITIEKPVLKVVSTRLRARPGYCATAALTSNYQLRLTGTLTLGVGTLRVETGQWSPHGLTEADFVERRIYKGGDATIGSGTLLATLSGSTWTWATLGVIVGDTLWAEIDANTGVGATRTMRSETVYTAA